jgi:hypothetical protein
MNYLKNDRPDRIFLAFLTIRIFIAWQQNQFYILAEISMQII